MHNCKATRERVTELLLDGAQERPLELLVCQACREEFDALQKTLRTTRRQLESAAPEARFWNDYHQKLRLQLAEVEVDKTYGRPVQVIASRVSWLSGLFTHSIRVPIPVAAVLVVCFALSLLIVSRASQRELPPQPVSVVRVPIEVPVVQEKVVTKVVYRELKRRNVPTSVNPNVDNSTVAKSQKVSAPDLRGFKPLDEVKLTVIKGGSPDEK